MSMQTRQTQFANIHVGAFGHEPEDRQLDRVNAALAKIAEGPVGRALLDQIARHEAEGKRVVVVLPAPGQESQTLPMLTAAQIGATERMNAKGQKVTISPEYQNKQHNTLALRLSNRPLLGRGKRQGTGAVVEWDPGSSLRLDARGRPTDLDGAADKSYLVLAHELIHALKIQKGTSHVGWGDRHNPLMPAGREELRVVGLAWYGGKAITENKIRAEHGEPLRTQYNKHG
jgi:hypothetical protein